MLECKVRYQKTLRFIWKHTYLQFRAIAAVKMNIDFQCSVIVVEAIVQE
jgi:hypothetical protein